MEVTIAVVSFNTRELLLGCLRSLAGEVDAGRAEVWVVDNDSIDGSADAARTEAPWARVVQAGTNLGFGSAVNLVANQTASEWLLAANADVALCPGALQTMLLTGAGDRVGCVAPRLLLPDGRTQHSVYPLPSVPATALFNLGLHRLSRRLGDWLCLEGYWDPERARAVPWAIGACLLFRREAYKSVGGFDEQRWMYAEDLDLGWELHESGWITRYEPAARVLHQAGAAAIPAFGRWRADRFMAATYAMLHQKRGPVKALITASLNVAGAAGRLAWMAPLAAVSPHWRGRSEENRRWLRAHVNGFRALLPSRAPWRRSAS